MAGSLNIEFAPLKSVAGGAKKGGKGKHKASHTLVIFAGADLVTGATTADLVDADLLAHGAAAAKFKGKAKSAFEILVPAGVDADRLLVIGAQKGKDETAADYVNLGGFIRGKLSSGARVTIVFDLPDGADVPASAASDLALGLRLRDYKFESYKTKKKDDSATDDGDTSVTIAVADVAAVEAAAEASAGLAEGIILARNLVNEPANVLFPEEFAARAKALEDLGVEVEILDEKALAKLGMRALLGVGQGSHFGSRVAIMRWRGVKSKAKPIAFIGKGVTFDTGGISIKPAAGMEDMKGDMGGAACVVGLMHALASRKAKVDVIGAIGLVENMPDGKAQRPGDIVKSMSGQTIEVINTDAEGRLVLCDVLWHVQEKYKPAFMIDLATLTGAILVALGQEYSGLFSNNDELVQRLEKASKLTGEKVWRMPLCPAFDKMIDSKFADMKNTGGRFAGSSTAAHFLQRFVNDTPWAHLDIAGTGMSSPSSETNQSWGSGWGVRLLDRLVSEYYETK